MTRVADVMTPFARTVRATQPVAAARDLMLEEGFHAVPVVGDHGELRGIVTSLDLLDGWPPTASVERAMTPDVRTTVATTTVADAALAMLRENIHHLVVVDGDAIVGMLSSFDLLRSLVDTVHEMTAASITAEIGTGDELVVARPDGEWRGRLLEAPAHGRPPFSVRWSDDPAEGAHTVTVVRHDDHVLDACER